MYNYSSRTYSLYPALYLATIRSRLLPDYLNDPRSRAVPGLCGNYILCIRCRASPGLFGHYPKPGFSRTVRPLYDAGLLPDCSNEPRSRPAPGLSGYSPKSGFPSLPRLHKAFLRRQKRIYLIITILTYGKISSLRTHTPDTNTYDTQ